MVVTRLVEVFRVGEGRATNSVCQLHVIVDETHEERVAAEAEQLRVEAVIRLMDAVEVAASDRILVAVVNRRQPLHRLQRCRQSDPQGGLPLEDLADLVDLAHLVDSEAAHEGARFRSLTTIPICANRASAART